MSMQPNSNTPTSASCHLWAQRVGAVTAMRNNDTNPIGSSKEEDRTGLASKIMVATLPRTWLRKYISPFSSSIEQNYGTATHLSGNTSTSSLKQMWWSRIQTDKRMHAELARWPGGSSPEMGQLDFFTKAIACYEQQWLVLSDNDSNDDDVDD